MGAKKELSTNLAYLTSLPFNYLTTDQSSAAFSQHYQTNTMNQKPLQQFKYHLNHLRPPSLVPITIQQAAGGNGEYSPEGFLPTTSGALQASEPEPVLALIESSWTPKGTRSAQDHRMFRSNLGDNNTLSNSGNNTNFQALARGGDVRLAQLQLPLQLHLKLKPLPLPMPPPTSRSSPTATTNQLMNATDKRRRSIETQAIVLNQNSLNQPGATSAPTTTDSMSKSRADRDRRELMALTWREAKRILLLSSMSPTLVQKKLERRTADLHEKAYLNTRSAVGDSASSVWAPNVDAASSTAAATVATTTAPVTSSGMLTRRQQQEVELEQFTTSNPRWKSFQQQQQQQQQPPTVEPLLPPTTAYKSSSLNLLKPTTTLFYSTSTSTPISISTSTSSSTTQVNPSSLSPSLPQTAMQTTPLPPQTTPASTFATATTSGKGEVRRQRHSSQLQVSNKSYKYFFEDITFLTERLMMSFVSSSFNSSYLVPTLTTIN